MRMWMVPPYYLCDKHLLGEHCELHMFVGVLAKRSGVDGYIKNNLLEPLSIIERHESLVREMLRRGMRHTSCIYNQIVLHGFQSLEDLLGYLPTEYLIKKIDTLDSLNTLICRCDDCRQRFLEIENIK